MKENLNLLFDLLPAPGTKGYLVLEHLTSGNLQDRGEVMAVESVIRLSLCSNQDGDNPVPVYELLLNDDETHNPIEAHDRIRTWAAGFMLGARYAGETIGLTIMPTQPIDE
ncbi:hypothetical protein [Paracoccus sp. PAMC 22219]|uniref:hypothetical protein n=1 Tax=Paracoccus sp. PAMC 22219 TaxID=1569209 RepID=UPI0005A8C462|nr:hypothetical protein [Paracoccus sp. PAMC 22219]